MAIRVRVTNKTKGTSILLPAGAPGYSPALGDGKYTFEPILSSSVIGEEFTVVGVDPAPVNLTLPSAVGEATEGKTVTGIPGVYDGAASLTAQWMDGSTALGPAGYDLAVLRAMGGKSPFLREAATNAKGTTYADSLPIGPITTAPQFTTQPALSGTPTAGQPMTATAGVADGFPAPQVIGRIERQLGTTGDWMTVEGGLSGVFVSGYRYRVSSTAANVVQTVEASSTPTVVVAATVAPLAAGANLPKQTIIQNTGTTVIAADSLFTGKVDTYALVSPPSGFTINATTGAISVNTASLALRTDETITVRASNDTPATLDRTFVIEVVNASGTATVPGAVTLGTVTIATGPEPGSASVTNVKLPPNGGSPLTNMRLRVDNVNYDYPATLGTHVIRGLPAGAKKGIVLGVNAIGPSSVWSSQISFTVAAPLQPPSAFSYEVTPSPMVQGKAGKLLLSAQGKKPMTYSITVDGQNYSNTTGEFDGTVFSAGAKTFTGTITNGDAPDLSISGGFTVAPYVAPTVSATMSPASPVAGDDVTISVTASAGTTVSVSYTKDGAPEVDLTAPYRIDDIENGRYTISVDAEDSYEGIATTSLVFAVGVGVQTFSDEFDGASGAQLASRPGWTLASGNAATFTLNGTGAVNMGTTGAAALLVEQLADTNLRVFGQISRPPSGGAEQAGLLFAYQDANNFCRLLINQGTLRVGRVIGGAGMVELANYGSIFNGASGTVRPVAVDWNANEFRVSVDGTRAAPISGSETFSPAVTGMRGGIWGYGGGGGRTPFIHNITGLRSTLLASTDPENPTNPQPTVDNIVHNIADVYQISAPVSGSMRIRPYGATTGGTITTGTGSVAGVLPGDGVWHVAIDTGSGYGAPVSIFAQKVHGGLGQWYGRNAKSISIAPMSNGSQIVPVPEDGKDGIMFEIEPKAKQVNGQWLHGVMKNKYATTGIGLPGHAFDSRELVNNTIRTVEAFRLSDMHTTWPDTFKAGDVYTKVISKEQSEFPSLTQGIFRDGIVNHLMGATAHAAPLVANQLAGQLFKGPSFSQAAVNLPGYAALLSKIQALQLPCTISQTHLDYIYDKMINQGNWQYSILRGGQYWKDTHETVTPYKHTYPPGSTTGNYYTFQLYEAAVMVLMSDRWTNAQKKNVLDALIFTGQHSDTPGMRARLSAGMGQTHELPVALKRLAEGRRFEDMTLPESQGGQWGAKYAAYFKWTADMMPMLDRHTNNSWPIFSREREVVAVSASGGNARFHMTWFTAIGAGYGDKDTKQRFAGLEVVRVSTGEALPYDASLDGDIDSKVWTTINGKQCVQRGVIGNFSTPLQVGEKIYMRIPASKKPFVGMADWMYAAEERVVNNLWTYYNATPAQSYRDQAVAYGFAALLNKLGEIPRTSPYRALVEYVIRTNNAGAANNGWCNEYPRPHFVGEGGWIGTFFSANKVALGLTMADL